MERAYKWAVVRETLSLGLALVAIAYLVTRTTGLP